MNQLLTKFSAIISNSDLHIPQGTPDNSLSTLLKIVFALAGAISLVVITVAGLQMVLSQGNPDQVNKSRNAVIYALVGLVICVTGYSLVSFVVGKL
ncbi:MAG: hypothetical protein ACXWLH_02250 [Candidatus Saccharimonadales bacterium]